ncbi:MAG: cysteine--tRNA ligase, partial [Pseudomonadota bacterium]
MAHQAPVTPQTQPQLTLFNTLTRTKAPFTPIDPANVRFYVCGPTIYDDAHIGNARPLIVFDVLFRVLRHSYGADHVTYVRNVTDVDDKINARAAEAGVPIAAITQTTYARFFEDCGALGLLAPTVEPRATDHIDEMRSMIDDLVASGHAYSAQDHVLFSVSSLTSYGSLSNRSVEEMQAGARVEVAPYKRNPMDFVLWKPSHDGEPAWPSPAGIATPGRPGWHIECSAMARTHLGDRFDIHGGGIDLTFPHHENERAQSCAATGCDQMANVWMHNGFLQVEGEKMSKSVGNFITIRTLTEQWHGDVLRLAMLTTHYRQPIDWTRRCLSDTRKALESFYGALAKADPEALQSEEPATDTGAQDARGIGDVPTEFFKALSDDLNTPKALAELHKIRQRCADGDPAAPAELKAAGALLGILQADPETWRATHTAIDDELDVAAIEALIAARTQARRDKDFAK